jgi:hypothetical protein
MITVTVNNKYAYHIAFCLFMIKVDYILYTDRNYNRTIILNDTEHTSYYQRLTKTLSDETNFFLPFEVIFYIMKHKLNIVIGENASISNIILGEPSCKCGEGIINIEKELYIRLTAYNLNLNILPRYNVINWGVQLYYDRSATHKEIAFYNMRVIRVTMTLMTFLLVLRFRTEGVNLGLDQYFRNIILEAKYTNPGIPNIAVIFHGYTRNYIERSVSHIKFLVNNPYIDIFMHVWTDVGHKYEKKLEKINPEDIIAKYKPKKFASEYVWDKLKPEFSLIGKSNPIFLHNSQDKADATQYVNATLYSIKKAYESMQLYESVNNFQYNGVIKWNFDTDMRALNMLEFWEEIHDPPPSLYFKEGEDLDTSWYYGNRSLMGRALSLYDHALILAQANQIKNMQNLSNVKYYQELNFIYIYDNQHQRVKSKYDLNTAILCYHPDDLMYYYLNDGISTTCKTSKSIGGSIIKPAVFGNNL